MRSWIAPTSSHCEGAPPFARDRVFPVLPQSSQTERRADLPADGEGLLDLLALDRLPLEEDGDGHDAAPLVCRAPPDVASALNCLVQDPPNRLPR